MKISEATVGTKVKSNMAFAGVPKYTEGIIDEDYGSGVMVAWDLIDRPLPSNFDTPTTKVVGFSGLCLNSLPGR